MDRAVICFKPYLAAAGTGRANRTEQRGTEQAAGPQRPQEHALTCANTKMQGHGRLLAAAARKAHQEPKRGKLIWCSPPRVLHHRPATSGQPPCTHAGPTPSLLASDRLSCTLPTSWAGRPPEHTSATVRGRNDKHGGGRSIHCASRQANNHKPKAAGKTPGFC